MFRLQWSTGNAKILAVFTLCPGDADGGGGGAAPKHWVFTQLAHWFDLLSDKMLGILQALPPSLPTRGDTARSGQGILTAIKSEGERGLTRSQSALVDTTPTTKLKKLWKLALSFCVYVWWCMRERTFNNEIKYIATSDQETFIQIYLSMIKMLNGPNNF